MNKHEIIRIFKDLKKSGINKMSPDSVISYLEQLYEPGMVIVPKSVHNFIQSCVNDRVDLIRALNLFLVDKENRDWIEQGHNQELFVCGYMFGSKPQDNAKYLVKFKDLLEGSNYLNCYKRDEEWKFASDLETEDFRTQHTKAELEQAGFGWVFSCPSIECIEVKENE